MVLLRLNRSVEELTRLARERVTAQRAAEDAAWNAALSALRSVLAAHHAAYGPDAPLAIGDLFCQAGAQSGCSGTTIQLAFDRLEALGEARYRIGRGVYVLPAS